MSDRTTVLLAGFAALLAAAAIAIHLIRHGLGDLFGIITPAGIILLMVIIISRHRGTRV